jgi:Anti-sigma factor NepR
LFQSLALGGVFAGTAVAAAEINLRSPCSRSFFQRRWKVGRRGASGSGVEKISFKNIYGNFLLIWNQTAPARVEPVELPSRDIGCGTLDMNTTRTKKVEDLDAVAAPDPKSVEAIGQALAKHYASLVEAPLPDKFKELLARLEREQSSSKPGSADALD